ncbi:MAG TPA: ABC transporter permease, partial [Gemmataceae bacterium]
MASSDASWNARLQSAIEYLKTNSTAQAACEGVAAVLLVGEAAAVLWWHASLAGPVQVLLWAQIVATAACLRWAGLFPLFGPVLIYDLVRTSRSNRYYYVRVLYASILSIMLFWGYWMVYSDAAHFGRVLRNNDLTKFSAGFFYAYMIVQFSLVILLTPAYTAGAIAEEKERKTLPYLLATDLRDREIILGKLMSRMLNLTLFILTGLPILSFLQFMGGIDPGLLLAGFAATGLTMLGLAALSMVNSALTRRARDAIIVTYVEAFAYIALSGASWLLLLIPGALTFPSFGNWISPVTLLDVVEWFNAGNLVSIMVEILKVLRGGGQLDLLVPHLLRNYALFMSLLTILCLTWAILRMRSQALQEAGEATRTRRRVALFAARPRVGKWPMIWKEVFVERGPRLHWLARILVALLIVATFLPVVGIVASYVEARYYPARSSFYWGSDPWRDFVQQMNLWARFVCAGV